MSRLMEKLTVGGCAFSPILIIAYFVVCYIVNFVKFMNCDFAEPFKDEIIHGIGVFTFFGSGITVWF